MDADASSLLASAAVAAPDADELEPRGRAGGEPRSELRGRPVVIAAGEQDRDAVREGQRRRSGEQRDIAR